MTAEFIAKALDGRKVGSGWMARCPVHDDREPSLSIRDGDDDKVLVCCQAGCGQQQVLAALKARGLWGANGRHRAKSTRPHPPRITNDDEPKRMEAALRIRQEAISAIGTPLEVYFQSRGIFIALPPTIRFHGGLRHPSGGVWPGMVALITRANDDTPLGIHRTFLSREGSGKAPVVPQKMMLGPCRGGAVRLSPLGDVLMVGEGIETCLAAMQATGRPAWAALSTSGLRALDLPAEARDLIVLADGDDPGEAASRDAALRWKREGRRVCIARAPQGLDFNDLLLGRWPFVGEGLA